MSATVVIELLVTGSLSLLWTLLWISLVTDPALLVALFSQHKEPSLALSAIIAYALGVIFDRVWDLATKRLIDRPVRKRIFESKAEYQKVRVRVLGSESLRAFFDYIRSRLRIARSAIFCFPLAGVGAAGCIFIYSPVPRHAMAYGLLGAGAVLGVVSLLAYLELLKSYYKEMKKFGAA